MSKLTKKFQSQSHGNLLDSNLYRTKKNRVKSFFSFGTIRGSSVSTQNENEPERSNSFRSFVSKSFLEENRNVENKQKPQIKQLIEEFISDEDKYCEHLEFIYMKMTHLEIEHKFDLEGILFELKTNVSEIFLPNLENFIDSIWEFLLYFSRDNGLFDIYKRFLIKHSFMMFYLNNFNKSILEQEEVEHFALPKSRLMQYIEFLNKIKQFYETYSAVYDKILESIKFLNDIINSTDEYLASNMLCKIIKYEKIHIEKCKKFINTVVPLIPPMYKSLIGNIHEIYEKEQEVLEDMKLCLLKEEDNDVVIDKYLKYKTLFTLYVENEKRDRTMQTTFCERYHVNENLFMIVADHLFNLKHIFGTWNGDDPQSHSAQTELKNLIVDSLHSIDHLFAASKIFGANISISAQGDVVLRSVLQVRYERDEPFRSMVFLFEKSIVFTKEDKITTNVVGYLFHSSIPIECLGIEGTGKSDNFIKVFHQSKYRKLHYHTISSCNGNNDEITMWKSKIMEILYEQIKKLKEENQY